MKRILIVCAVLSLPVGAAEVNFSGFGSIIGTQVTGGDGYVAHYPTIAKYDDKFDLIPESRFGLQATAIFSDEISATLQVTTRGSLDWDLTAEWFYLTWEPSTWSRIQLGRMRLPAYLYSDYMDVGYAYNFIRVPGDAYSIDAVNYNGLSATFLHSFGSVDTSFQVYGGREQTNPNILMSYIRQFEHDRDYTNLYGVVGNLYYKWLTLRATYLTSDITEEADASAPPPWVPILRTLPNGRVITDDFNIKFWDFAVLLDFSPANIVLEYNEYEYYTSWLASLSYNFGKFTPHITLSEFELNEAWESHTSFAVGFKYDVISGVALKMQIDKFDDTGYNPFTGNPNPICKCGDGDVTVISAGVDFVF